MAKKMYLFISMLLAAHQLLAQTDSEKLEELMAAYSEQGVFNGSVLVAREGGILLEKGYGFRDRVRGDAIDAHTVYQIGSVTKTFTSTLVMNLAESGFLSLDDCLSKYYPDYPNGDSITVRQLLTHTSGIYNYTQSNDFMSDQAAKPATEQRMLSLFRDKKTDFPPGAGWNYSNSGYSLLDYIVQKVTGTSYEEAVRHYFFSPLGMSGSGFDFAHLVSADKAVGYYADSTGVYTKPTAIVDSSVSFAAGAIYSTIGDLYRWHRGLQDHIIITENSLRSATTPLRNNYGFGWMIDSLYGKKIVSHSGGIWGFRSNFARVSGDDLCIVLLSNTETPSLDGITRNILALLYGQPYRVPGTSKPVAVDRKKLESYCGTYQFDEINLLVDVRLENGELIAQPANGPRSVLLAGDETHFFMKGEEGFRFHFTRDTSGNVSGMQIDNNGRQASGRKLD